MSYEDDYEKAKRLEEERMARKAEEQSKFGKQKQEELARTKESDSKHNREIKLWAAQFDGETPRHREIRELIYSGKLSPKEKETLKAEYQSLPWEYPNREYTFNKVTYYECERLGLKFVSKDGHSWTVEGIRPEDMMERFKEQPKVMVDSETHLPIGYTFLVLNAGLYDFQRRGQLAKVKVKLEGD